MTKDEAREILQKLSNGVLTFMEAEAIECAIQALGDGWVSVEDGLPEETGKYLSVYKSEEDTGVYIGRYWADGFNKYITHWQPLPSPPKPKQP